MSCIHSRSELRRIVVAFVLDLNAKLNGSGIVSMFEPKVLRIICDYYPNGNHWHFTFWDKGVYKGPDPVTPTTDDETEDIIMKEVENFMYHKMENLQSSVNV